MAGCLKGRSPLLSMVTMIVVLLPPFGGDAQSSTFDPTAVDLQLSVNAVTDGSLDTVSLRRVFPAEFTSIAVSPQFEERPTSTADPLVQMDEMGSAAVGLSTAAGHSHDIRLLTPSSTELPQQSTALVSLTHPVKLHVMGEFATKGWFPEGTAHQYAAQLAVEDINARPDVLPGYILDLVPFDSQCKISVALEEMFRLLYNTTMRFIMVVGGTCSHVTEQTAIVAHKYNMLHLSDNSISPTLSGPLYPWFFRVVDSETVLTRVRVLLLRHFNWTTITLIQGPERINSATMEEMRENMEQFGITSDTLPFENDPSSALRIAKENNARILFLASYEDPALLAVCDAYRLGLYGPRVVWIFPHFIDFRQDDLVSNCTMEEKLQVLDGYFTVASVAFLEGNNDTIGANETEYHRRFKDLVLAEKLADLAPLKALNLTEYDHQVELWTARTRNYDGSVYILRGQDRAPHGYDAMWAAALALNATLSHLLDNGSSAGALADLSYDKRELGEVIYHKMRETSFRGLSGQVSFDSAGDRVPLIAVRQFRVLNFSTGEVKFNTLGYYEGSALTWLPDADIYWRGNKVPVSSRQYQRELRDLPLPVLAATGALAAAAIFQSLVFLYFNIRHRHVRIIRMSSPNINNLILLGCILFIGSVFAMDNTFFGIINLCHIRLCLLVLGFSLSYGALFAKTWRVYEVMTASKKLSKVRKDLRDGRLYMTVMLLAVVNMGVIGTWVAIDEMTLQLVDIPDSAMELNEDVTELGQTLVCQSHYKLHFTVLLFSLQGLLILLGTYLALQTRQLNDSKWIGMCVYNCLVLGGVGAILVLGMRQKPVVTYLLESFLVIIGTVVTQTLIFVPKLLDYRLLKKGKLGPGLTVRTLELGPHCGQTNLSAAPESTHSGRY